MDRAETSVISSSTSRTRSLETPILRATSAVDGNGLSMSVLAMLSHYNVPYIRHPPEGQLPPMHNLPPVPRTAGSKPICRVIAAFRIAPVAPRISSPAMAAITSKIRFGIPNSKARDVIGYGRVADQALSEAVSIHVCGLRQLGPIAVAKPTYRG